MDLDIPNSQDIPRHKSYLELLQEKLLHFTVLDGLDGSGKGTLSNEFARFAKGRHLNIVQVDFPNYTTELGQLIRKMLKGGGLSKEERFALYALNRLECIDEIKRKVEEVYRTNGYAVQLVFDRFSTSNLLTLAYFLQAEDLKNIHLDQISTKIDEMNLEDILRVIEENDRDFHRLLGINLEQQVIWIPNVEPEVSLQRAQNDETRDGVDNYEVIEVQTIAYHLYRKAMEYSIFQFRYIWGEDGETLSARPDVELNNQFWDSPFIPKKLDQNGFEIEPITLQVKEILDHNYSPEVQEAMNRVMSRLPENIEAKLEG